MISDILTGKFLQASSKCTNYIPQYNQPSIGMVRYNSSKLQVYDGSYWCDLSSDSYISLTPEAESAILWAINKQAEENRLKELCNLHPSIKSVYEEKLKAEEKLKILMLLIDESKL